MINHLHIKEALRIFKRARRVKKHGIKKYKGTPEQICKQILDDCYNKEKKFFQVSAGHFSEFYARDFGMIVNSLMKLGYKDEVHRTLQYALHNYAKHYKVTTQITPDDKPLDTFDMATDSLPFLIYSLNTAKADDLIFVYKDFLQMEINKYVDKVVDKDTGLVKRNKYFSSMKDNVIRDCSCYDNCMVGFLVQEAKKAGLFVALKKHNYPKLIKKHFWNGKFFLDSLGNKKLSTDANTFPYWTGLITDKKMIKSSIKAVKKAKLDIPLPAKYDINHKTNKELGFMKLVVPNYEGDTCWIHLGICYMDVVSKVDKKLLKKYIDAHTKSIKKHKNFLELHTKDDKPFQTFYYYTDESMSWCATYLYLKKKFT